MIEAFCDSFGSSSTAPCTIATLPALVRIDVVTAGRFACRQSSSWQDVELLLALGTESCAAERRRLNKVKAQSHILLDEKVCLGTVAVRLLTSECFPDLLCNLKQGAIVRSRLATILAPMAATQVPILVRAQAASMLRQHDDVVQL